MGLRIPACAYIVFSVLQSPLDMSNTNATLVNEYQVHFYLNCRAGIVGAFVGGPYLLAERFSGQRYRSLLTTGLLRLLEDAPLPLRQRLWLRYTAGRISSRN
jgi:hypothetical protein